MKSTINILLIGILVCQLVACSNDQASESEETVVLNKLSKTWEITSVDLDGEDVSGAFAELKITFSKDKTISVVNPVESIWPSSGTFEIVKSGNNFIINRDDGIEIILLEITENSLVMNFQYSAGSRVSSVSGGYTFEMNP